LNSKSRSLWWYSSFFRDQI